MTRFGVPARRAVPRLRSAKSRLTFPEIAEEIRHHFPAMSKALLALLPAAAALEICPGEGDRYGASRSSTPPQCSFELRAAHPEARMQRFATRCRARDRR